MSKVPSNKSFAIIYIGFVCLISVNEFVAIRFRRPHQIHRQSSVRKVSPSSAPSGCDQKSF